MAALSRTSRLRQRGHAASPDVLGRHDVDRRGDLGSRLRRPGHHRDLCVSELFETQIGKFAYLLFVLFICYCSSYRQTRNHERDQPHPKLQYRHGFLELLPPSQPTGPRVFAVSAAVAIAYRTNSDPTYTL